MTGGHHPGLRENRLALLQLLLRQERDFTRGSFNGELCRQLSDRFELSSRVPRTKSIMKSAAPAFFSARKKFQLRSDDFSKWIGCLPRELVMVVMTERSENNRRKTSILKKII